MIKGPQIDRIRQTPDVEFHYITAISKPQIQSLMDRGVLQMELFDQPLAEVTDAEQRVRYVLRRNPVRAGEIRTSRASKLESLRAALAEKNKYLLEHARARAKTVVAGLSKRIEKLGLKAWTEVTIDGRHVQLKVLDDELAEPSQLDGCYAIKTDLKAEALPAQAVHDRYKDLIQVEQAFRTGKTAHLEMRPWFVRCEASTRGHALVVLLAYRLVQELQACWRTLDCTVEEGLRQLDSLCITEVWVCGKISGLLVPKGRANVGKLLELAQVETPRTIKPNKANVHTKTKLKRNNK